MFVKQQRERSKSEGNYVLCVIRLRTSEWDRNWGFYSMKVEFYLNGFINRGLCIVAILGEIGVVPV